MLSIKYVRKEPSYQALSWSVGADSQRQRIAHTSETRAIKHTQGHFFRVFAICAIIGHAVSNSVFSNTLWPHYLVASLSTFNLSG